MPETNLKELVLSAIQMSDTDEDKAIAAMRAFSFWYLTQGYFNRSYEIDAQIDE